MPVPFILAKSVIEMAAAMAAAAKGAGANASADGAGAPNSNLAGAGGADVAGVAALGRDAYAEIYSELLATRLEKKCKKQIAEHLGGFFDGASEAQLAALAGSLSHTDPLVREFEQGVKAALDKLVAQLELLTKK